MVLSRRLCKLQELGSAVWDGALASCPGLKNIYISLCLSGVFCWNCLFIPNPRSRVVFLLQYFITAQARGLEG